ncbi:MAG: hypothetical protein ABFD10_21810 [Prolixibacteraceae bacterium]
MTKYIVFFTVIFAFLYGNAENKPDGNIPKNDQRSKLQSASSRAKLNADAEIPILAWFSIPASATSAERYREMKDAGITCSLSFLPNINEVKRALDAAEQAGIKLLVSCPELEKDPEKTVKQLMDHPAIAGYHLRDEPPIQLYPELAAWAKKIQSVDDKHFCYVNLFPNLANEKQLGTESYEKYVQEYLDQIPVQFVSFDYYPVFKNHISESWYKNLELISKKSNEAGKPFWAFVLTTNYDNDHVTPQTLAAMRLQAFSNLAYGAQGIQYFTYWAATSVNTPPAEDQRGAPITVTGKRSIVYDRVKQMSKEIQNLSDVFLGAKTISVRHTGLDRIPDGTIRLTSLPEAVKVFDTHGAPALVSVLEKGERSFFVIVNKDFQSNMKFTIYGDDSLKRILKDGTIVPASAYEPSMELDPGDVAVYMFPTEENHK